MVVFYVIGNYSVMFLLHKNAPRGCDQMSAEADCIWREKRNKSLKLEGFREFEEDLSALFCNT